MRDRRESSADDGHEAAAETEEIGVLDAAELIAAVDRLNASLLSDAEVSNLLLTGVEGLDWDLRSERSDSIYVSATHEAVQPLRAATLQQIRNQLRHHGQVSLQKILADGPPTQDDDSVEDPLEARVADLVARLGRLEERDTPS